MPGLQTAGFDLVYFLQICMCREKRKIMSREKKVVFQDSFFDFGVGVQIFSFDPINFFSPQMSSSHKLNPILAKNQILNPFMTLTMI